MRPSLRPAVLATAAVTIAAGAAAQTPAPSWRPTMRVQSEVRSDNNPFLLDTLHKQRLAAPTSADSVNGRFRDMNRATDVIASRCLCSVSSKNGLLSERTSLW